MLCKRKIRPTVWPPLKRDMTNSFDCQRAQGVEANLRSARRYLERAGKDTAALDARLLFTHATGLEFAAVLLAPKLELNEAQHKAFCAAISRRGAGEPVARITGVKEFWGLEFGLNEATLIPRPDSETLIEAVLAYLKQGKISQPLRILDLGTGTGCLLAALLFELPQASGVGVDLSPEAVSQARQNMQSLNLGARAEILQGAWFAPVSGQFEVIVSNPPYITEAEMAELDVEVRIHDPRLALTPEGNGLAPYKDICANAVEYLAPNGILAFEHGSTQAEAVLRICEAAGFEKLSVHDDLAGHNRVILVQKTHKI